MDMFKKTLKPVEKVLKDAGLKKTEIHDIVLVGGSTRIPKVLCEVAGPICLFVGSRTAGKLL